MADARDAGLRWVTDSLPGIRRLRAGRRFQYLRPDGTPVDRDTRRRIQALAIPPAWARVWICDRADGHLQAARLRRPPSQAVSLSQRMAPPARREQVRTAGELRAFRTWTATVHAAQLLLSRATPQTSAERQRAITETVTAVARGLRNTPAVCRRSYIHPHISEAFEHFMTISDATPKGHHRAAGIRAIERPVLRLLDDTPCRVRKVG